MSGHTILRLSGGFLVLGGVSGVTAHILHLPYHPTKPAEVLPYVTKSEPVHVLLFAAVLLVLLGLPGLLVRQSEKIGAGGLIGFVLVYFGLMLAEGIHCVLEMGIYPAMARQIPNDIIAVVDRMYGGSPYSYLENVGGGLLLLGILLLGISMLIASTLPRWNAVLLLATDLGAILAYTPWTHWMVGVRWPAVLYLAFAAIGFSLIRQVSAEQASSTAAAAAASQGS
jgi:hypothetical protein